MTESEADVSSKKSHTDKLSKYLSKLYNKKKGIMFINGMITILLIASVALFIVKVSTIKLVEQKVQVVSVDKDNSSHQFVSSFGSSSTVLNNVSVYTSWLIPGGKVYNVGDEMNVRLPRSTDNNTLSSEIEESESYRKRHEAYNIAIITMLILSYILWMRKPIIHRYCKKVDASIL